MSYFCVLTQLQVTHALLSQIFLNMCVCGEKISQKGHISMFQLLNPLQKTHNIYVTAGYKVQV